MHRRVVVTGIGLVTPIGSDLETTWASLLAGKNGAGPITQFDTTNYATKFGCEVKSWDGSKWFDKRELKHVDRFLQFGIAAAGYTSDPRGSVFSMAFALPWLLAAQLFRHAAARG